MGDAARLREAAALMRKRAEAAESMLASPWNVGPAGANGGGARDGFSIGYATDNPLAGLVATCADYVPLTAADHLASWHPAVALAVADWLDTAGADIWAHGPLCECGTGCDACDDNLWEPHARAALALADAYLGGAS